MLGYHNLKGAADGYVDQSGGGKQRTNERGSGAWCRVVAAKTTTWGGRRADERTGYGLLLAVTDASNGGSWAAASVWAVHACSSTVNAPFTSLPLAVESRENGTIHCTAGICVLHTCDSTNCKKLRTQNALTGLGERLGQGAGGCARVLQEQASQPQHMRRTDRAKEPSRNNSSGCAAVHVCCIVCNRQQVGLTHAPQDILQSWTKWQLPMHAVCFVFAASRAPCP